MRSWIILLLVTLTACSGGGGGNETALCIHPELADTWVEWQPNIGTMTRPESTLPKWAEAMGNVRLNGELEEDSVWQLLYSPWQVFAHDHEVTWVRWYRVDGSTEETIIEAYINQGGPTILAGDPSVELFESGLLCFFDPSNWANGMWLISVEWETQCVTGGPIEVHEAEGIVPLPIPFQ